MKERAGRVELDRMHFFLQQLGVPNGGNAKFIHVAGTNGKGSTTSFTQAIARGQGWKTGGYFSPYVYDLKERFQIDGNYISENDLANFMSRILPIARAMENTDFGGPTEFEVKTAIGFLLWQQEQADVVALEVGIGGRLDSTNVVRPAACIITSIAYDHQKMLGDQLSQIATEKAGIAKSGAPLIVGNVPDEAWQAIQARAAEVGVEPWKFGRDITVKECAGSFSVSFPTGEITNLRCPLYGEMQHHNAALAISALAAANLLPKPELVASCLASAKLPGRFQTAEHQGRTIILDGAHNQESAKILATNLRAKFGDRKCILISGMLGGHDPIPFYRELAAVTDELKLVDLTFRRSQHADDLLQALTQELPHIQVAESVSTAVKQACADGSDRPIVVTGSFYLLSDLNDQMPELGLA